MMLLLLLTHPVFLIVFSILATAVTIGFTSANSFIRPALLPVICAETWLIVLTCKQRIAQFALASIIAGNGPTYLLLYIDLALLSKYTFEAGGPTASPDSRDFQPKKESRTDASSLRSVHIAEIPQRLYFGLYTTLSPRRVNTPYQVKSIPLFSKNNPNFLPSRNLFLWQAIFTILCCYTLIDLSSLGSSKTEDNAVLFAQSNVPFFSRLREISAEQIAIRIVSTIGIWLNIYCLTRFGHNVLAFVFISTGISEVKAWRPPFGSIFDAYSVRKFWGIFWHQFFRQAFSSPSNYIAHVILRLPPTGIVQRYAKIFFVFFISGVLHQSVDLALGMSLFESGAVAFFCTQALGIILEDGVQAAYHSRWKTNTKESEMWFRYVGYLWVLLFMAWSTPIWSYPAIRRNTDPVLPFSVLGALKSS